MRRLSILIITLSLCLNIFGQDIPKRANTIMVEAADTITMTSITKLLVEHGYGIQHSDKDAGVITTTSRSVKRAGETKLIISLNNNKATVRGTYHSTSIAIGNVIDDSWQTIDYRGLKGSPSMEAWNEMFKIANAIGGRLTFEVR